ncbi:MAG: ATP-dependent sacrificial sulfur transferase LarE [Anaerolineales bacterium]|nr:MAG: ATP-dependent sacrificial sulfur transferase LarE [Anaerolineales bacterium]
MKPRRTGSIFSPEQQERAPAVSETKIGRLEDLIARLESVVVAFSGGVDSTLILALCLQVLGPDRVLAVTANSPTLPRSELDEAAALARELGARHVIITTVELQDERFATNPPDRCYYCKQELFTRLRTVADREGCKHIVYGATAADLGDLRPGMRAAREAGAIAPLLDAGFTKEDVRSLSQQLGLRTWDKPAMACLSSRFPYGTRITQENLRRVERGEHLLRHQLGFRQVRVRQHDSIARIEIHPEEFPRLLEELTRGHIISQFKKLGYTYVTLDLEGFRSGSMNEPLRASSAQLSCHSGRSQTSLVPGSER